MSDKYRKKPVVIEAFQMTYENFMARDRWPVWLLQAYAKIRRSPGSLYVHGDSWDGKEYLRLITLEGTMTVSPDDYIIRGVVGELYPCRREIFEATYEKVDYGY